MKKLKLKLDGVKAMLTREQMKKISGGYGCNAAWYCDQPWNPLYDPLNCSICQDPDNFDCDERPCRDGWFEVDCTMTWVSYCPNGYIGCWPDNAPFTTC